MGKKKYSVALKQKCKQDFAAGMTVVAVAEKHGLPVSVTKRWHATEGWKDYRRMLKQKLEESLLNEFTQRVVENTRQHIDASRLACRIGLEITADKYKKRGTGTITEDELFAAAQDLAALAKNTATVQKLVVPEAQQEVMMAAIRQFDQIISGDDEECE